MYVCADSCQCSAYSYLHHWQNYQYIPHYHVWVVEVARACNLGEIGVVVAIEPNDAAEASPGVLDVAIITPDVTVAGNAGVVRLYMNTSHTGLGLQ